MRFSELHLDQVVQNTHIQISSSAIRNYLNATGDDSDLYWPGNALTLAPPMAVAALTFQTLAQEVILEPGTLHTGQELSIHRLVPIGTVLAVQSRVGAFSKRRDMTSLTIETTVHTTDGQPAMTGRMTLLIVAIDSPDTVPASGVQLGPIPDDFTVAPKHYPLAPLSQGHVTPMTRTLTQERINAYAVASGDDNPIHIDPHFAANSPFGTTIAHGMLVLSYLSTALTCDLGIEWLEHGYIKVRFRHPALVDSTVTVGGTAEHKQEDAVQYALYALQVINSAEDVLVTGVARSRIGALISGA